MEFSRQEYWSRLPFSSPGDLPNPAGIPCRDQACIFLHWQADSLPLSHQGSPFVSCCCHSVTKSCPAFCNPMNFIMPGFLSFTISQSLLKLLSIELVMPSNHLILCHPLLFLPSIFLSISVFSNELALCIIWPKY